MLSKNQIKFIIQLRQKKNRLKHQLFIAEGVKVINELLDSNFKLHGLFTVDPFNSNANFDEIIISQTELKKISCLTTPNKALAVFKMPKPRPVNKEQLIVALDDVRDPGNLGTIIRLCDWFGIGDLVCSAKTVDVYNPKVVQATMGSITRVNVSYVDLSVFLDKVETTVFGAFMDGKSIYESKLPNTGVLILGNEANGISESIKNHINQRISIPRFGTLKATESLNVATATAILLSEFRKSL